MSSAQAIPQLSLNIDQSDQYGLVIDPYYANLITPNTALGIEIAFGTKEFRLAGTWSGLFCSHHLLKLTAEYLSQNTLFEFDQIPLSLWDEQTAVGMSYSYLTNYYGISSYDAGLYHLQARDESMNPRTYDLPDYLLYRDVSGSTAFGGYVGLTSQPSRCTRIRGAVFYDEIQFRNTFEPSPDHQGLGGQIDLQQILHRRLLLRLSAQERSLYNQYVAQLSWLVPCSRCAKVELSLKGQRTTGDHLAYSCENRISVMMSYRWNLPTCKPDYMTIKPEEEDILIAATQPVIKMPQVFVAREQHKDFH